MAPAQTASDVRTFERQGYLIDPLVLNHRQALELAGRLTELFGRHAANGHEPKADAPGLVVTTPFATVMREIAAQDESVAELTRHPVLVRRVRELLGAEPRLAASAAWPRPAELSVARLWRQVSAAYSPTPARLVCVQVALDDATEETGCLVALPRSHQDGLARHSLQDGEWLVDITRPEVLLRSGTARPVPLPAGGCVYFDGLLLHASLPSHSPRPGWVIQLEYVAAEA